MSSAQGFVPIETISRRDAVRRIALAVTAAGIGRSIPSADAAQVHAQVEEERTLPEGYTVKFFKEHEFRTLERLSELIVPADEGGPSGRDGGAPEFIDLLVSQNPDLAEIFGGGLLWLDGVCGQEHGKSFTDVSEEGQTAILDALVVAEREVAGGRTRRSSSTYPRFAVFGVAKPSDMRAGLRFWVWTRRLVVDAYYTSPAGIKDLGFVGNASHTVYEVPSEPIDYAMSRSPFRGA